MAVSPYRFSWYDAEEELEENSDGLDEFEQDESETGYMRKVKDVASDYMEKTGEEMDELMEDNMFWFSLGLGPIGPAVYASYKAGGATAEYAENFWSDYDESVDLNALDEMPEGYDDGRFWESAVDSALDILDKPVDQLQGYRESFSEKYKDFKDQTGSYISAAVDALNPAGEYDEDEYELEDSLES